MTNVYKRPECVLFPSIWSRFEGKKEINGRIPKFWIQDIPEEMFDEAVKMMCKNYIYDEPLCKYSKLAEDEKSSKELEKRWKNVVKMKMGLICFMENPDPAGKPIIVGLNMTYPSCKEEPTNEYTGEKWFDTIMYVYEMKDIYSLLGIDRYLNSLGLSVLPEFRGQGIGEELLKARVPLCKAVGLPATITLFSARASQKLASRIGFEDIIQISYEELEKINPRFTYPGIAEHTRISRLMYLMID